ncbi:hypothetical protein GLOIN_2v1873989 [Rhizophagus irregularis DAOM 181602=DAOM 197198]|uniref:F-box domain-containing protein n=2 Tax=Rhizophagus irregularis TaxID=588596 RepID=A0A2P4Q8E1_RHIID|nr:hypothetical protein GLOIN_2v1873989 [Rhizophagus irregularis DAOM 181602=DAOM 197198]POG73892.1 hypothetical protein GLOIN_2v1873989 [Rhizophagus irregularis DAOM 181602=DAOM 197198]|eukprot:XP_025180758.1 hypothetical protein GLOIN_2v1873989 [Rhizophagus irregularis DAOM 181602=DAOM 197198]
MSCSKIFSGDLPELIYEIIKYLQNDYSTLYSCILVNKLWCRLAIPLLWENPFSIPTKNYKFIEIYLHNLNDDDFNTKLNEYKIVNNSLPSNILFNYPRFLKYLNIYEFIYLVEKWFKSATGIRKQLATTDFEKLSFICVSIFRIIIIENEVNLHTLEIEKSGFDYYLTCIDNILELILKNPNFIHNIRNLNLYFGSSYIGKYTLMNNRISQIIKLHQNLKKIMLDYYDCIPLYQSLLSEYFNCSNTLNTIIFHYVNLNCIRNLQKVFELLNVLESVHIYYCFGLNTSFIQQIINLTKPFKLKSLFMNDISQVESLELLLQKSGDYLENFGYILEVNFKLSSKHQLLELITKYCKNIKFLDFHYGCERQIIYQLLNLIENIKLSINYLSFDVWYGYTETGGYSSIILQDLGQILPSKLEYLCLNIYHVKTNDFELFLKNIQDTFIKKLVIENFQNLFNTILPSIKEYIMKKKRVKYLAIKNSISFKELISLKDEVDEFKLYNIKVQSFDDLKINLRNYIKKID